MNLRRHVNQMILFACVVLFCMTYSLKARAAEAIENLYVTGFYEARESTKLYVQHQLDGQYALLFPTGANLQQIVLHTEQVEAAVMINGAIYNGEALNLASGESIQVQVGEDEARNVVISRGENLASIFVNTKSGSMHYINLQKGNKESGNMCLMMPDGSLSYEGELKSIKGRGNSSWEEAQKKSYNLKFENKVDLYQMGKAKSWCLIANSFDPTNMRNWLTYKMAERMQCEYTMDCRPCEVYFNGRYNGLYLLTEKVEIDNNRINITDLTKATEKVNDDDLEKYPLGGEREGALPGSTRHVNIPNNPSDITGGYLIEIDYPTRYLREVSGFVTKRGFTFVIKEPEYASKEQAEYISKLFQQVEDLVYADGTVTDIGMAGKTLEDYIDVDSFARMAILQELVKESDALVSSFYIYKDSDESGDGKLHATTAWDFDLSFGLYRKPSMWAVLRPENVLTEIMGSPEVKNRIPDIWREDAVPVIEEALAEREVPYVDGLIPALAYEKWIQKSVLRNNSFWNNVDGRPSKYTITDFLRQSSNNIQASIDKGCIIGLCSWTPGAVLEEPGCESEGKRRYVCSNCGAKKDKVIPAKGHTYDEGVIIKAPTDTEEGEKRYTCQVCGNTKTEIMPRLGNLEGWVTLGGLKYWYENGIRQGYIPEDPLYRGKEIFDPESGEWYWLDNENQGAMAFSKDVYQESLAGQWGDKLNKDGTRTGKWVRYDREGHMIKGWCAGYGENARKIANPAEGQGDSIYYFDLVYGTMAKGFASIGTTEYFFSIATGVMESCVGEVPQMGWYEYNGVEYWYENYIRQGYSIDPSYRGKEVYDPASNAWYWLDNIDAGKKAVSKDVYQESQADDEGHKGKWVRYDKEGHMIKGWSAGIGTSAREITGPDAAPQEAVYYFDYVYGTMAKGTKNIDGIEYHFDEVTGQLIR